MKKTIIALVALSAAVSVLAQGTVLFNTASSANGVNMRVYGPEVGNANLSKTGNTSAQTPAGSATYTGAVLAGAGYWAVLYAASGASAAEGSLVAATPTTTFRTGSAAGVVAPLTATLSGVPLDAPVATIQLRAWDNSSGLYNTWAQAETAWTAGLIAAGKSPTLNVTAIGGTLNAPPYLAGLQSFNIYMQGAVVPEPSTFAFLGLGALGMLIFRRK